MGKRRVRGEGVGGTLWGCAGVEGAGEEGREGGVRGRGERVSRLCFSLPQCHPTH